MLNCSIKKYFCLVHMNVHILWHTVVIKYENREVFSFYKESTKSVLSACHSVCNNKYNHFLLTVTHTTILWPLG